METEGDALAVRGEQFGQTSLITVNKGSTAVKCNTNMRKHAYRRATHLFSPTDGHTTVSA